MMITNIVKRINKPYYRQFLPSTVYTCVYLDSDFDIVSIIWKADKLGHTDKY